MTRVAVPYDGEVAFATALKSRSYVVQDGTVEVDPEDVPDFLRILEGSTIIGDSNDTAKVSEDGLDTGKVITEVPKGYVTGDTK